MKLKQIKLFLVNELQVQKSDPRLSERKGLGRDTKSHFFYLGKKSKRSHPRRLHGLHSYNLLDHPDYI